jgi:hypothetical protein
MFEGKEQAEVIVDVRNARCGGNLETLNFIFDKHAPQWKLIAVPYT